MSHKPPSPEPMHRENYVAEALADDDDDIASTDPPPPYPNSSLRGSRRSRGTLRSSRRTNYQTATITQQTPSEVGQAVETSPVVESSPFGDSETSPLLPTSANNNNRRRATSHSSTTHSIGHSVITSSRNVISLFQTDPDPASADAETHSSQYIPFFIRIQRYFRPLVKRAYYSAIFHLLFINFPFELFAWIYLFVGTLTGTTLLITLPLGVILCFLDLLGARALARGEIFLQTVFHGPLSISPPNPPNPIFSRKRALAESTSDIESPGADRELVAETSFLKLAYLMFTDPTSYQALFYFLVIKPGITLLILIGILTLLPPAIILVIPAPAVLRAIRRVGIWQAEIAIDALK